MSYYAITSAADLNAALALVNGTGGGNTFDFYNGFTLDRTLTPINLGAGGSLNIIGEGFTMSGGDAYGGFFVAAGIVNISNLAINHTVQIGGNGSTSFDYFYGGGGAGLGGGLFVGAAAKVALDNVTFASDGAVGGNSSDRGSNNRTASGGALAGSGGLAQYQGGYLSNYGYVPGGQQRFYLTGNPAGFGGGGASAYYGTEDAGFGGGGGYGYDTYTFRHGTSGFGGGTNQDIPRYFYLNGAGGLGAGGSVFVQQGGSLTIAGNTSVSGGYVRGGNPSLPAALGQGSAIGNGIFLQGNEVLTFAPGAGQTALISDTISDMASFGATGTGSLVLNGVGRLELGASNQFAGGVTVKGGTLALGHSAGAGSGAITFARHANATLYVASGAQPGNVIKGFDATDRIDLQRFGAGTTGSITGDVLTVTYGGLTDTFNLDPARLGGTAVVTISSDLSGGSFIGFHNLLANGDFQDNDMSLSRPYAGSDYFYGASNGWTASGLRAPGSGYSSAGAFQPSAANSPALAGTNTAFIESGGYIEQTFAAPGNYAKYRISFDAGERTDTLANTLLVNVYAGSTLVGQASFNPSKAGAGNSTHFSLDTIDLAAAGLLGQAITVKINGTGASGGYGVLVDNVTATALDLRAGASAGTGNQLTDGDFQQVDLSNTGPGVFVNTTLGNYTQSAPAGWVGGAVLAPTANAMPGFVNSTAAYLNGSSMSQTFSAPGTYNNYQISLDLGRRADYPASVGLVQVYAGATLVAQQAFTSADYPAGSANHLTLTTSGLAAAGLLGQAIQVKISETSGQSQLLIGNVMATGLNLVTSGTSTNPSGTTFYGTAGADTLAGGTGNDTFDGGAGADAFDGGGGTNTVSYASAATGTKAVLFETYYNQGEAAGDTYANIQNLTGSTHDDQLFGDAGNNVLSGGAGTDVLFGMAGDDTLIGGSANAGSYNQLWGGAGSDTASYAGATGEVYADLLATGGWLRAPGGTYVLTDSYNSIENLIGGSGADVLAGDAGDNVLEGGAGADQLYGRGGANTFVYHSYSDSNVPGSYDTIADFKTGIDKLDLSAFQTDASHIVISQGASSAKLWLEATPGVFNAATDLAISLVGANVIVMGDIKFA